MTRQQARHPELPPATRNNSSLKWKPETGKYASVSSPQQTIRSPSAAPSERLSFPILHTQYSRIFWSTEPLSLRASSLPSGQPAN